MRDDPDKVARDLARDLCSRATLAQMREDAEQLATLVRERELPELPEDDAARIQILMRELVYERHRSRVILALLAG